MKRGIKIWAGIIVVILIAALCAYLIFFRQGNFNIPNIDYSAGSGVGDSIGRATNTNAFNKLNPFRQ